MATVDAAWTSAALSHAVCDVLVSSGKLPEKPAFRRTDREAKITSIFTAASLDGGAMAKMSGREVEVAVRNATQGEAWVDDVQRALKSMLSREALEAKVSTESAEMKQLREKVIASARVEADPPRGERRSGERRSGEDKDRDDTFSSFGRRGGTDGRECYNCGAPPPPPSAFAGASARTRRSRDPPSHAERETRTGMMGHLSRDCPESRNESRGGGYGGGGRGRDDAEYSSFGGRGNGGGRECYNCGGFGHLSRDCPEPRDGGGGGGGGRECYTCGQLGHISRDCPSAR